MNDRTISIVKVQHHNNGYYIRIPADVVRQVRIKKADYIRVSLSVDKRVIKLTKDDTNDIINLDEPARPEQHILVEQADPAQRNRLSEWMQGLGLAK